MIRTAMLVALGAVAFDMLLPQAHAETSGASLDAARWEKRPLLIFAPNEAKANEQWSRLQERRSELADRDMLVISIAGNSVETRAGDITIGTAADELRDRYRVAADATAVLLVGKDGRQKRRWDGSAAPREIFDEIDAMPMRQREMRDS